MPVREGMLIADKFRLIRLLGKGGMGSVWVAEHLGLDTHVAVKFMSTEHAENQEAVERFKREAAAAARIKSPHVVQIFDHGFTRENIPYIVMELLDGEDLMRRILRAGPLPVAFVCDVVMQVCKALGRAHKLGIVHRDIKPENIFLSEMDGERLVKVLDFGIAKGMPESNLSMTSTGAALGSPYYMSPEQIMSAKGVDPRSDLWSLGIVAYQALTGKLPFDGETVGALAVSINDGIYAPPSSLVKTIPRAVDDWFKSVFVRKPEGRFASAREMAKAFEEAIGPLEFADAQTSVAPFPSFDEEDVSTGGARRVELTPSDVSPLNPESIPTAPLVDSGPSPGSPALAHTHLTATLSGGLKQKQKSLVMGGVAIGVGLFIGGLIVIALWAGKPNPTIGEVLPAAPVPTETAVEPPPAAPPAVSPTVEPSATAEPTPPAAPTKTGTKKKKTYVAPAPKPAPSPTSKKKDRGF